MEKMIRELLDGGLTATEIAEMAKTTEAKIAQEEAARVKRENDLAEARAKMIEATVNYLLFSGMPQEMIEEVDWGQVEKNIDMITELFLPKSITGQSDEHKPIKVYVKSAGNAHSKDVFEELREVLEGIF